MSNTSIKKKVYCGKCLHSKTERSSYDASAIDACIHPKNKGEGVMADNYFERVTYKTDSVKHPRELNKNNDCKWFEFKS